MGKSADFLKFNRKKSLLFTVLSAICSVSLGIEIYDFLFSIFYLEKPLLNKFGNKKLEIRTESGLPHKLL